MHLLKVVKEYGNRVKLKDLALLKICVCALGILIGVMVPRKKKMRTGAIASGVFVATSIPLFNKLFDISDELIEQKTK